MKFLCLTISPLHCTNAVEDFFASAGAAQNISSKQDWVNWKWHFKIIILSPDMYERKDRRVKD